jgi:hypothetical protein
LILFSVANLILSENACKDFRIFTISVYDAESLKSSLTLDSCILIDLTDESGINCVDVESVLTFKGLIFQLYL